MSKFPCPSCATERVSEQATCIKCGWPRVLTSVTREGPLAHRPAQFKLRSMLIFETVACIAFAIIGRYGINGFVELLDAALLLIIPVLIMIEVYYRWIHDDMEGT